VRVPVTIEEAELETDEGRMIDGVVAICTRCDHEVESYGTSERSVKRCLALMREECPEGESNFYVDENE